LHHDNALAHDALAARDFGQKSIMKLDHPPYSPDLAPGPVLGLAIPKSEDRFERPQIFRHCRHSGTCDDHPCRAFQKRSSRNVFEQCNHRLTKCVGAQGDYFEGDSNHLCVSTAKKP
jgi:hypothetical protein